MITINELKHLDKGNIYIHLGENNIFKSISILVSYDKHTQYEFIYNSKRIFENIENHIKYIYDDFKEFQFINKKESFTILNVLYVDKYDTKTTLEVKNTGFLNIITQLTILEEAVKNETICLNYIEYGLHPFQIKKLFDVINEYVISKNLICFIQTCSSSVLNIFMTNEEYKHRYDMIFYTGDEKYDINRLSENENTEYLKCFSLGDLYTEFDYIR